MITAQLVADYFLALAQECEEPITNLKLNKLVYYTQAWHLALSGNPLFDEKIEAWVHGPVLPAVYDTYKQFQWRPIDTIDLNLEEIKQHFDSEQQTLLNDITEIYFPETGYALEQLTHSEDPWIFAREGLAPYEPSHNVITRDSMRVYYAKKLAEEEERNEETRKAC
jgi:uncharacterized phage-associated protein